MKLGPRVKKFLAVGLLAVVCIGGAELAACRFADPALYEQSVGFVRRGAESAWRAVSGGAAFVRDGAVFVWDAGAGLAARAAELLDGREETPLLEDIQAAKEPEAPLPAPPADPTITAMEQRGDAEVLTGGTREIVYYNQADPAWCDQPYGKDTLGKYGCGPTTLAMAVSSLTDRAMTPEDAAQWAVKNGYWARRGGSYLAIVNGAAALGLRVDSAPECDAERLRQELAGGKMAVALMGKGHFTNGGHFILLRGATLDGSILVADPNSRERSLTVWDPQLVLDELSKSRNDGAPLWFLSPEEGE